MAIRKRKKVLVTGCGRSGTKSISVLMRVMGLHVLHERMGRDGIASWLMTSEAGRVPWSPSRKGFEFENIFHLVRHPLYAIPSIASFKEKTWRFIYEMTPCSPKDHIIIRSARYWYYWNEMTEEIADCRLMIEDRSSIIDVLCKRFSITKDSSMLGLVDCIPKDINTTKLGKTFHRYEEFCLRMGWLPSIYIKNKLFPLNFSNFPLSWEDLYNLDTDLESRIKKKAIFYGYTC